MALRDFFSLSEIAVQKVADNLGVIDDSPETLFSPSEPIAESSAYTPCLQEGLDPSFPAIQNLAQEMEQCRLRLLDLLLENPIAVSLLTEQLSQPLSEGVDFSQRSAYRYTDKHIVQDHNFVQVDGEQFSYSQPLENLDAFKSANVNSLVELRRIHFFPVLLIRIADIIKHQNNESQHGDSVYKFKLQESRNRLQNLRQKMINSNTGLVAFVACKHKTASLNFEDLMQEGIIGLIRAVDRFDPNRGIRFSTYSIFWIKQAISRLIIKQEKVVRLPVALAEKATQVFEAMRKCYLENNRWPSLPELQAECSLTPDDIKTVSSYYQATHSLDASLSDDDDSPSLLDGLKQQQFSLPLDELIDTNLSLYIGHVVASLPEKEAAILNMRFGLKNHTEMTLQAIADQLHVTRERVRQIQNQALKKLRQQFGFDLADFLEPNDI